MKIEPTCRYGHGPLRRLENFWSLNGVDVIQATTESNTEEPLQSLLQNGRAFMVIMFRCPKCGYLELFDDVTDNE